LSAEDGGEMKIEASAVIERPVAEV